VEAQRVVRRRDSHIFQTVTDGGEVVSLTRQTIPVTGCGAVETRGSHICQTITDGGGIVSLTRRLT
jgi:hypothetical protein